jgi:cellulose synthase/poly-beta-1,6-N-acetylglucosamine synthase-like glycosyltransferase
MSLVASATLVVLSMLLALPAFILCVEVLASFLPYRGIFAAEQERDEKNSIAVVIPAHNEVCGIEAVIGSVRTQLQPRDRLIVVADNCSDATAEVARKAGAEIVERKDPIRRGKGYALAFGLNYLRNNPPRTVIFLDADCRISSNLLDVLTAICERTSRPVQAKYLNVPPLESETNFAVAAFAQILKNFVRPMGLQRLGLPCQLMGTGMAFPWEVIRAAPLASGHITEDIKLGLDLASAGHSPLFCPKVEVLSDFPYSTSGARSQRERWEMGHLQIISSIMVWLREAVFARKWLLLALTLDVAVPPLALLVLLLVALSLLSFLGAVLGVSELAFLISTTALSATLVVSLAAWWVHGRDVLPPQMLQRVFPYVANKLYLYLKALSRSDAPQWTRTDRDRPS